MEDKLIEDLLKNSAIFKEIMGIAKKCDDIVEKANRKAKEIGRPESKLRKEDGKYWLRLKLRLSVWFGRLSVRLGLRLVV